MSQAEELLNSLSIDEASTYSARASEERIVIGDDRFWVVPNSMKKIAVQYDHNIETITFSIPRYWDTKDMSTMQVYINYLLPDKTPGSYIGDGFGVDPNNSDRLIFSWTISRNVTQLKGNVYALICVKDVDDNGNERVHWNSELCRDLYISEGLETDAPPPVEEYPDIITQLLMRMTTVETINVQKEEMEQILAEARAANDYCDETLASLEEASEGFFNNYANAVKGNVSGSIVRVDDVSPMEHFVKCRVHGKNLFDGTLTNGIYLDENFTIDQGSYTFGVFNCIKVLLRAGTYTISFSVPVNIIREIIDNEYRLVNGVGYTNITTYTFTTTTDGYYGLSFRDTTNSSTVWNTANTIQIEKGFIATEHVEYIDPSSVSVYRCGKNLIQYPYATGSTAFLGVTFVSKTDGSVFANGTSTDNTIYYLSQSGRTVLYLHPGTYRLSGCPEGGTDTTYRITVKTGDPVPVYWHDYGRGCTFTIDTFKQVYVYIRIAQNTTVTNLKFKPQLELANETTGYEVGFQETYATDADATCEAISKSPSMTLFADTPGVTIEAEYNRDTTKMFESYVLTDEAKSEIAERIEGDIAEVFASLNEYATSVIGGDG